MKRSAIGPVFLMCAHHVKHLRSDQMNDSSNKLVVAILSTSFTTQYDFGNPRTFSPIKLRMSCGLIGAMRGIITSRR